MELRPPIIRYEVQGPHGTSEVGTYADAVTLAAERERLYPELGPFIVLTVQYAFHSATIQKG